MAQLKILFVVSEVEGLAKSGGLADVGYALPQALAAAGHDVRIVCPYYRQIRNQHPAATVVTQLSFALPGKHYQCAVRQLQQGRVKVYAIDYPDYFDRNGMYDDGYEAYPDNGLRFSFFSLGSLELAMKLMFQPDIIHCNDWQTGPLPLFLKQRFAGHPFFAKSRSVISIHNAAYQGLFPRHSLKIDAEIPDALQAPLGREDGLLNLLQCGVQASDKIVAVSPTYAEELKTPLGSHGLFTSFMQRAEDLSGILNGCDYQSWDPTTDKNLPANYSAQDLSGKAVCKQALQQQLGLPQNPDVPLFGMVCRLTDQKGLTLLLPALDQLLAEEMQLAIIGTGDPLLSRRLTEYSKANPTKLVFYNGFDNKLAHLAYAGSDIFMMPSLYEPCGLAQMYSLAYGTLPLVREVGGLKDTVIGFETDRVQANGFSFEEPSAEALRDCMLGAARLWRGNRDTIAVLQQRAMSTRFTWQQAASDYLALYQQMRPR